MKYNREQTDRLYEAILKLGSVEECRAFFDDICTIKEINDLSQRFAVAALLDSGKNYAEIAEATGASTATICRVSKALNYGSDGYRTILDRIKEDKTDKETEK